MILIFLCCFCVVDIEYAGKHIPMAFLERVKEDFNKRYDGGKATTVNLTA